jgi:hypothetical protein
MQLCLHFLSYVVGYGLCPKSYEIKALQFGDLHYQINDFKEQTLQLARLAFHEEEVHSFWNSFGSII